MNKEESLLQSIKEEEPLTFRMAPLVILYNT